MTDAELARTLDTIYAYDMGTAGGVHDIALRDRCRRELARRAGGGPTAARLFEARLIRRGFLSERALRDGYGMEDAVHFLAWLIERMGWPPIGGLTELRGL